MRHKIAAYAFVMTVLIASNGSAAVVYSGIRDVAVPLTFDGIYLNIVTSATSSGEPGSWDTGPWVNPFFGGTQIATSDHFRSVITGTDQIVNLAHGTAINGSNIFAAGASGSTTHVGSGIDQFQVGSLGYLGFQMEASPGGTTLYGWMSLTVNNAGFGFIHDWAYEDTGAELLVGLLTIPEPSRAMLTLLGSMLVALRRRRTA
ncbi:MAG: PEP-CTERM sorting domain-containing protein [Verrucomicrobiaceae bacterium]|nr:PEP-CTERM sorting domain-containing protein [Verrucomicrobiaceae bacterium]